MIKRRDKVCLTFWHDINPRRISPEKFMAVIEIPKGVKNKYEMDKETGLFAS